jgi:hypothetical protein
MNRIRIKWSGPGVAGPGLTTFYTISGEMDPAAFLSFFDALKTYLPDDVQVTVPSSGDSMSEIGGAITNSWAAVGGGVVSGTSSGTFAIGQGVRIVWDTDGIRNGRHVRGTTFLVPVVSTVYDTSGRVAPAVQTAITTAANNLRTALSGALVIWSRPKGVQGGILSPVTSVQVPETPTALRSRRY